MSFALAEYVICLAKGAGCVLFGILVISIIAFLAVILLSALSEKM